MKVRSRGVLSNTIPDFTGVIYCSSVNKTARVTEPQLKQQLLKLLAVYFYITNTLLILLNLEFALLGLISHGSRYFLQSSLLDLSYPYLFPF